MKDMGSEEPQRWSKLASIRAVPLKSELIILADSPFIAIGGTYRTLAVILLTDNEHHPWLWTVMVDLEHQTLPLYYTSNVLKLLDLRNQLSSL